MNRRGMLRGAAAMGLLVGLGAMAPGGHTSAPLVYGDVDGDGSVTVTDAMLALRMALNLDPATPERVQRGDIAPFPGMSGRPIGDGVVDLADATQVLRIAVGIIAPPRPHAVSFAIDVLPILQSTCEGGICHGGGPPKGGLRMKPGNEYDVLVNVESMEAPGVIRVAPGDPDHSYLYAKLTDSQDALGGGGNRMPAGEGLRPQPLPDDEIATIRGWIAEGAPNN